MSEKVLAEDWGFQVTEDTLTIASDGTTAPSESGVTWVDMTNVKSFGVGYEEVEVDATDFDSTSFMEDIRVRRRLNVSLEHNRNEDETTGARSQGQAILSEASRIVGESANRYFKITSPGGLVCIMKARYTVGSVGGDMNALTTFDATLKSQGPYYSAPNFL